MPNIPVVYVEQSFKFLVQKYFYKNDRKVDVNKATENGLTYCLTTNKSDIVPTLGWANVV